jgi:hypothetical protein
LIRFAADRTALAAGIDSLGRAELALARARRQRVWGLWSFASEIFSGGAALHAANGRTPRDTTVGFPQFLSLMGRTRFTRQLRQSAAGKTGARFHVSRRKATEIYLPFLEAIARERGGHRRSAERAELAASVVQELGLTPEEVGVILGAGPEESVVTRLFAGSKAEPAATPEDGSPTTTSRRARTPRGKSSTPGARPGQRRLGSS